MKRSLAIWLTSLILGLLSSIAAHDTYAYCTTRERIELRREGMSPAEIDELCEAPIGYSAQAHCGRTGVTGMARGQPTPERALHMAIVDCIDRGGIPYCCEQGASLTR